MGVLSPPLPVFKLYDLEEAPSVLSPLSQSAGRITLVAKRLGERLTHYIWIRQSTQLCNQLCCHTGHLYSLFLYFMHLFILSTNPLLYSNYVPSLVLVTGEKAFHLSSGLHFIREDRQMNGTSSQIFCAFVGKVQGTWWAYAIQLKESWEVLGRDIETET